MALIQCPECGRQVSDKAHSCPGCGTDLQSYDSNTKKNKPNLKVSKWGFLVAGLVLGLVVGTVIGLTLPIGEKREAAVKSGDTNTNSSVPKELNQETGEKAGEESKAPVEVKEVSVGDSMEIHHEFGNYTLTIERVRKSDWLQRSDETEQNNIAVLVECDIKNESYDDPYNEAMFIDHHIIAVDNNNYTLESWGTAYDDGVYNLSPTIPAGTNGKIVIPYIVNKDCPTLTITVNDEYKVTASIEG